MVTGEISLGGIIFATISIRLIGRFFFKDTQMVFKNAEMVGKSQERERDEERRTAKGGF